MKPHLKVIIIVLGVILLLGLIGFIVWWACNHKTSTKNQHRVAIVTSFPYHFECLGFLLDMLVDEYEVDFYHVPDPHNYVQYFKTKYSFSSFLLSEKKLNSSTYKFVIKLSNDDPYVVDPTKLIVIQHSRHMKSPQTPVNVISLSPLVFGPNSNKADVIIPFWNGEDSSNQPIRSSFPKMGVFWMKKRTKQIVIIGIGSFPLEDLAKYMNYEIVVLCRSPQMGDKKLSETFSNLKFMYNVGAKDLMDIVSKSSFVFIGKKTRVFSGAIALALSANVPMLMDSSQAKAYASHFPTLTYEKSPKELTDRLNRMSSEEYTSHVEKLKYCRKTLRKLNIEKMATILNITTLLSFRPRMSAKGELPSCFTSAHNEAGEREIADMFTPPDACVLEFGGGAGAVSTIVQRHLKNPRDHVVIQPVSGKGSETPMMGGISILLKNKKACKGQYQVIDHVLKKGEGKDLLKLVSKPFDTLVVDCEGCLTGEYDKNPDLFEHVTMIQVERDDVALNTTRYDPLFEKLGFKKIFTGKGCGTACATDVWIKK